MTPAKTAKKTAAKKTVAKKAPAKKAAAKKAAAKKTAARHPKDEPTGRAELSEEESQAPDPATFEVKGTGLKGEVLPVDKSGLHSIPSSVHNPAYAVDTSK